MLPFRGGIILKEYGSYNTVIDPPELVYILDVPFTQPDSPPISDPVVGNVGQLDVTDSGNNLEIAGDVLTFAGDAGVRGDPGVSGRDGAGSLFARQEGQLFTMMFNFTSFGNDSGLGVGAGTTTFPSRGGYIRSSGIFKLQDSTDPSILTISLGVDYGLAQLVLSGKMSTYLKIGAGDWELIYVRNIAAPVSLDWMVSSGVGALFDAVGSMRGIYLPDNNMDITTLEDIDNDSITGNISQGATLTAAVNYMFLLDIDTLPAANEDRIWLRQVGNDILAWRINSDGTHAIESSNNGGSSWTPVAASSSNVIAGQTVLGNLDGNNITIWRNGATRITATSSVANTSTQITVDDLADGLAISDMYTFDKIVPASNLLDTLNTMIEV